MSVRTLRQKARRAWPEKYKGDPYVPLVSSRLKAAVELDGRSLGVLKEAIRREHGLTYSKQNLHHLMSKGFRCRASLRQALAATLGVADDLLAGSDTVPAPLFLRLYRVVSTVLTKPGPPRRIPPRALLSAQRFIERCRPAVRREIRHRPGEDLEALVGELLDPTVWRAVLLDFPYPVSDSELEEIVPLLAHCLEKILRPWLENRPQPVRLKRQRIRNLVRVWDRVAGRTFRGKPPTVLPQRRKPPAEGSARAPQEPHT